MTRSNRSLWPFLPVLFAGLLIVLLATVGSRPAFAEFDIDKVERSVVRVFAKGIKNGRNTSWSGSGFVLNGQGYVATNNHVVAGSSTLVVADGSFERLRRATIVWADANVDLAVIKVEGLARPSVALSIPEPKKGTPAFAVGFPGHGDGMERAARRGKPSLESTVTAGVVGKVFDGSHTTNSETIRRMVQHNAEINPGNSGGPLFNACNQVIAINTYGKTAVLRIVRHPKSGQPVAVGPVPAGIFSGSHVSVLIKALKAHNIAFTAAPAICKSTAVAGIARMPAEMYVYIAAAFLIGSAGFVLALRKPRERIVKVVESYSQMLRRKGGDKAAGSGTVAAKAPSPAAVPPPARPAGKAGPSSRPPSGGRSQSSKKGAVAGARAGWMLAGFDRDGHSVQLLVTDSELKRSPRGRVLGRKESLVHHVLSDRSVSRRHARIVPLGDAIGVVDLNSTHGTKVSGVDLTPFAEPTPLKPGSELMLGAVTLKVSRD